jgi:hypothetical protein
LTTCSEGATITGGTLLPPKLLPGGEKGFEGGGSGGSRVEHVLNPSTNYGVRVKNWGGAAKPTGLGFIGYGHTVANA